MKGSEKITVVACYDYSMAALCDGADMLLVGDSAGMVVLGYDSTTRVTMDEMCLFTGAVSRGRKDSMVVGDLPFMSYQACTADAIRNSGRLVRAGADAVKLEGGAAVADAVRGVTGAGIPVMGHIGLLPQTAALSGGYRVQGRTRESALRLAEDAKALEEAGAFAIVLEMVAEEAARMVTKSVGVPTIGIGSGAGCDGQVLVLHDMLGLYGRFRPKFAKVYADLSGEVAGAVAGFKAEVESSQFPRPENSFYMDAGEADGLDR
ncbi:3-methyl-2-oxobutanoate hydroxymethyltransferase [Cenarchaeum symbiosum A]|uniref:3-methyl-2-oxobutanoate hydroxymethyltransferase n=1 Tax=Cenarchaeum symbiosum (strain A) TaxID=414004 RepID=PANB_CENSY|nr:RecName: Full=3-methyl-2-oxobutanoate hydroxymethyltransferase; AltName: Full=Ketopantoate hydroxymethyltransferase; Short=KPHMT [Cenarchaeum symbiosum A]ABK78122.1 3-methyl-2-oxobutanoate hydroxymethyltransferase [Cenarchaeum symbiosum A]